MDSKDNYLLINNKLPKCTSCIYEYYCDWNEDSCTYIIDNKGDIIEHRSNVFIKN